MARRTSAERSAKASGFGCMSVLKLGCMSVLGLIALFVGAMYLFGPKLGEAPPDIADSPAPTPSQPVERQPPGEETNRSAPTASQPWDSPWEQNQRFIPGIVADDILADLRRRRFTVTEDPVEPQLTVWRCVRETSDYEVTVNIYGRTPEQIGPVVVIFINVTSNDSKSVTNSMAVDFISSMATLDYYDSQPRRARSWVENFIGRKAQTEIGRVSFEMNAAAPRVRSLLIEAISPPSDSGTSTRNSSPATVDPEALAARKLDLAKKLLKEGKPASNFLLQIIGEFPETNAAKEAGELLGQPTETP